MLDQSRHAVTAITTCISLARHLHASNHDGDVILRKLLSFVIITVILQVRIRYLCVAQGVHQPKPMPPSVVPILGTQTITSSKDRSD